jgi:hypothetical protein
MYPFKRPMAILWRHPAIHKRSFLAEHMTVPSKRPPLLLVTIWSCPLLQVSLQNHTHNAGTGPWDIFVFKAKRPNWPNGLDVGPRGGGYCPEKTNLKMTMGIFEFGRHFLSYVSTKVTPISGFPPILVSSTFESVNSLTCRQCCHRSKKIKPTSVSFFFMWWNYHDILCRKSRWKNLRTALDKVYCFY